MIGKKIEIEGNQRGSGLKILQEIKHTDNIQFNFFLFLFSSCETLASKDELFNRKIILL